MSQQRVLIKGKPLLEIADSQTHQQFLPRVFVQDVMVKDGV